MYIGLRSDNTVYQSVGVFACMLLSISVYSRFYVCMCAVQTIFPTAVPAGACWRRIPVCTTDRDFHSRKPADGAYMCQPLQQITNPAQQKAECSTLVV